jgi:SAM-dependent methyltransferase
VSEILNLDQALHTTHCPICGTEAASDEVFPATVSAGSFDTERFSARRLPDRVHYRVVRCRRCGLLRSDPAADSDSVADLYARSRFDYQAEVANLRRTYGRYLARLDQHGASRDGLLEVGCGNGFFLEEAVRRGYREVRGIEPSRDAILSAPESVRHLIVEDVLRPGALPPQSFAVACLFQVFDHLSEPAQALDELHRVLRSRGLILILNHDAGATSARLLGERSPIVDVEHFYLYTRRTLSRLVAAHGFEVVETGPVWNRYSLRYLTRLLPIAAGPKNILMGLLDRTGLRSLPVTVPLGNLFLVARRS